MNIIIPYRPSSGGLNSPTGPLYQDEDYLWRDEGGKAWNRILDGQEEIVRCVQALRKNSVYPHRIVIALDSDMYPQLDWLSEYGVETIKSTWVVPEGCAHIPQTRQSHTSHDAIMGLPNDAIVAHAYISDLVCGKRWDEPIVQAIDAHGFDKVYTPLFVEPRTIHKSHCWNCGECVREFVEPMGATTSDNIWGAWREYCCHSPTMRPPIDRNYAVEADLDEWSAACNAGGKNTIIEPCGARIYGYWAPIIARNNIFKDYAHELLNPVGDLAFEGSLGTKCVVCRSHVFHLHYRCDLEE